MKCFARLYNIHLIEAHNHIMSAAYVHCDGVYSLPPDIMAFHCNHYHGMPSNAHLVCCVQKAGKVSFRATVEDS